MTRPGLTRPDLTRPDLKSRAGRTAGRTNCVRLARTSAPHWCAIAPINPTDDIA